VGGFDLRAVEAVCCDDALPVDSVLDVLAGLVDKSILLREEHAGGLRFRFLETLREFGQTRLAEQGMSTESGRRHRDWYRQIIDDACARWFGPDQEMLCTSLHLEQANVREAIAFCLREPGEARVAQHMAGRPWFLWHVLFLTEGRQWLERVLDADTTPSPERARALATCGNVAAVQGDAAVARDRLVESQATSLELGDHATFAYACQVLGMSMVFTEPGQARDVLLTAIPLNESVQGAEDIVVAARLQLGAARLMEGDTATALEQFERCRDLCQTKGERWQLSYAYWGLGFAALIRGELKDAIAFARRSLMTKRAFRDLLGEAVVLDLLAWTHAASGDGESAAVLMGAASRLWRTFGQELFGSRQWAAPRERAERQAREAAGDRAFEAGLTRGKQLSLDEALAYALDEHPRSGSTPTGTQTALTRREREIAALIAEGLSNKEIAQRLVISHRTAEGHVEHILTKLGITSRAQIARRMNDPDRHSMP
jgi:non-specific serine/threonine protein kinase